MKLSTREQNNQEFINPEVTIEQTLSFAQQAQEIMQHKKDAYNFVIVPQGPLLFTGILHACGNLLAKKNNHFLIICEQTTNPNHILITEEPIGVFMGSVWSAKKIPPNIINKKYVQMISYTKREQKMLSIHLPFLRILNNPTTINTLFVGKNISTTQLKQTINTMTTKDTTTFFTTNLHQKLEYETAKANDYKLLKNILESKQKNISKFLLLSTFHQLCMQSNTQPEIIAYVNSGEINKDSQQTTGYACIVG